MTHSLNVEQLNAIALIAAHVTPTPLTLSMSISEHSSIPLPLEYSYLHTADRPSAFGYSVRWRHPTA
ncbi:hypothetical protein NDA07_03895 [Microcoleus vaginatus DQ-U2]|uniref:hypothetical protein n=1 Tax=Microcoleus vaginatus TaxID=119532 RepID=UPI001683F2B1|nr:hypothetical protein [Microcoleus sp. FACHB-DQ6]